MSRPIKVRCWDRERKRMTETRTLAELATANVTDRSAAEAQWLRFEVLEFTGLYDKNGKEIYEGDVLRVNAVSNQEVWRHGDGSWRLKDGQLNGEDLYRKHDCLEVIGNIYENPELLGSPSARPDNVVNLGGGSVKIK